MDRLKYVVVVSEEGREQPILFPEGLIHKEVAWRAGIAVSGGFCMIQPDGWVVRGRSESLDLDNRGEDDEFLLNAFFPIF